MERCGVVEYDGFLRCMNLIGHRGLHWAWDVDSYVTWGERDGVIGTLRGPAAAGGSPVSPR